MIHEGPVFSIVLPTFNRSKFIGAAIQSVMDQTFEDFELIVVDDGSTDDTREIVSAFSDPRVRYFFKANEERSIARNYGVGKSSGMYVNFLDSDDFFYSHHLETAFQNLKEKKFPELLHLRYELRSTSGAKQSVPEFHQNINQKLIFENFLNGSCFFIKRNVLDGLSFIPHRDANFSEDWYLWLRLAARFPIHTADAVTAVVREHEERSLRGVNPLKLERAILLVIEELKKDGVFLRYYKSSFDYFIAECFSLIALYYISVSKVRSVAYLLRSLNAYPLFVRRKRFWAILKNLIIKY